MSNEECQKLYCQHIWAQPYYGERTEKVLLNGKQEGQGRYIEKKSACLVSECIKCGAKRVLDE